MDSLTLLILLAHDFQYYFARFGYVGIYIFFVTVDQIAPIPEEITLVVFGYFASQGTINPFLAGAFSLAAFLTIDIIYFFLTKTGNKFIKKLELKTQGNPALTRYKRRLKDHLLKTLFILSFIPRIRLLSPVFVALARLPFRRFILYNAAAQAFFITVYITLGFIFHKSLSSLLSKLGVYQHVIFIGFLGFMVFMSFWIARKFKAAR